MIKVLVGNLSFMLQRDCGLGGGGWLAVFFFPRMVKGGVEGG